MRAGALISPPVRLALCWRAGRNAATAPIRDAHPGSCRPAVRDNAACDVTSTTSTTRHPGGQMAGSNRQVRDPSRSAEPSRYTFARTMSPSSTTKNTPMSKLRRFPSTISPRATLRPQPPPKRAASARPTTVRASRAMGRTASPARPSFGTCRRRWPIRRPAQSPQAAVRVMCVERGHVLEDDSSRVRNSHVGRRDRRYASCASTDICAAGQTA